ncbi:MAG TPA: DUF4388 domain-containing protein [Thermoanaerobaculia bacterium]|nr:DUF4388 domain-containing protein [Thermoanaerobaculia bacterium]
MALEGTLRDFSLADIFQLIGLQRKTGVLTLRGKDDTVSVTFLDGKVVSADSLNRRLENRLGTVLMKSGAISNDQLTRALEIQKETLQRLGFILTHYGFISQDNLRQAIQVQILQIIYRLFRWKDGDYQFSQETTIEYDRDHVVPITAESILMEGARMIDEWPIIEKRIRSYDMTFRKKPISQEIMVVQSEDADEIDFEESRTRTRRSAVLDKIKISEEEKSVYDLVNGRLTVGDIVESSRYGEFDTNKALYELLTRDLIEEVRDVTAEKTVEPEEEAEVPSVPLPLVLVLSVIAVVSIATSHRNPLDLTSATARRASSISEAQKAVSFQRIQTIGTAVEAYHLTNGRLPNALEDLAPHFIAPNVLKDPWGNNYKYLERPGKYLVIGFTSEGRPDTDLFLSHSVDVSLPTTSSRQPTGGITLVP